jgi:hypothetical protein
LLLPSGLRDLFVTGPGPDRGGSKPGRNGCAHMPEKSGMVLGWPLVAGAAAGAAGAAVCPKAGVASAAITASTHGKPCRHRLMISSLSWFAHQWSEPCAFHLVI